MVFFKESGIWKFHDVHLWDIKGDHYDMDLSKFLISPNLAAAEFSLKNPGKLVRSLAESVLNGTSSLVNWVEAEIDAFLKRIIMLFLGFFAGCLALALFYGHLRHKLAIRQ